MKVTIPQETLVEALKRGGFAALSDEAQTDTSNLSVLVKSVKIKVENSGITLESATALTASRYVIPVTEDISIKENGEVMVAAKNLTDWVSKQGDCMIGMRFSPLENPEMINASENTDDVASKAVIRKTGKLEVVSKDATKTGSKWKLDSYDPAQIPDLEMDAENPSLFEVPLAQLNEGVSCIGFSALPKDNDHIFDCISFQQKNNELYMLTTDTARCAIWNIPNADKINLPETLTVEQCSNGEMDEAWKHNILVPHKLLSSVCKLYSDSAPIIFHRDEKKNRIYISQPGFVIKSATAEKDQVAKFPPLDLLLVKKYNDLCSVSKNVLINRLNTVSLVNKESIMFTFNGDQLILDAISESGHSPCKANANISNLTEASKKVWNAKHYLEMLKVLKDDTVYVMAPDDRDKDSMKIISKSKPNVAYYLMAIQKSKYDTTLGD